MRRRILTVGNDLSAVGGTEIAQLRIMEGLASDGWSVELLYVHRGDLWPRWHATATSTRTLRACGVQRNAPVQSVLGALGVCVAALRGDGRIVYLHNPGDLPAALLASRGRRFPVVVHLHLPPPFRQPEWLNRLIRKASAIITPSADTAERWIRVAGVSRHLMSVIPTGVDPSHFVPLPAVARDEQRRTLGLDPGIPIILYAGRIDPTKGLSHLIEGVNRMDQQANLVICGAAVDADYVASLRTLAGARDVTWLDRRIDVASLLAAADLAVLPSLVHETQGMVLIEAMSCEVPAVGSSIGGIPETLAAFPDHLVPPGDPAALAATMDHMIGWRRTAPSLGGDVRKWVLDTLTLDRTVGAVSALLAKLGQ